jgi:hypothetical protein
VALSLDALDQWIDDRRDSRAWALGHQITRRMRSRSGKSSRGYVWLAERLLFRDICHCGWSEGIGLVMELVDAGEFYRITAPGRGPAGAVSHTLYFKGWVDRRLLEAELRKHNMPLEAFLELDRCLADHRRRVSFFRSANGAVQHQQGEPHGALKRERTDATASGRPSRATRDPPRAVKPAPAARPTTPSDGRLSEPAFGSMLEDIPEDLRYLYPHRFPDWTPPPARRRGQMWNRLRDSLPKLLRPDEAN